MFDTFVFESCRLNKDKQFRFATRLFIECLRVFLYVKRTGGREVFRHRRGHAVRGRRPQEGLRPVDAVSAACFEARRKASGISVFGTDGPPAALARSNGRLCPANTTELGLGKGTSATCQRRRRLRRLRQRRMQEALQTHGAR